MAGGDNASRSGVLGALFGAQVTRCLWGLHPSIPPLLPLPPPPSSLYLYLSIYRTISPSVSVSVSVSVSFSLSLSLSLSLDLSILCLPSFSLSPSPSLPPLHSNLNVSGSAGLLNVHMCSHPFEGGRVWDPGRVGRPGHTVRGAALQSTTQITLRSSSRKGPSL